MLITKRIKGRTIRQVRGGGGRVGNFLAAGIFFRYQIPCMKFFFCRSLNNFYG